MKEVKYCNGVSRCLEVSNGDVFDAFMRVLVCRTGCKREGVTWDEATRKVIVRSAVCFY